MCLVDRVDRESSSSSPSFSASDGSSDDAYSGEKPKNYSKRASLFSRPCVRRSIAASSECVETRKCMHMALMVGCLYLLLNAMSAADVSFGSRPRVLHQLKEVETRKVLQADSARTYAVYQQKKGTMLRSISSIYNKNEKNILNVINKDEWENHAYLPMPKLQPIDDETPTMANEQGETSGEIVQNKAKETYKNTGDNEDAAEN